MSNNNPNNGYLTNKQLCNYLNISRTLVDKLVKQGQIPYIRLDNNPRRKVIRFCIKDVDKWLESRIVKSDKTKL